MYLVPPTKIIRIRVNFSFNEIRSPFLLTLADNMHCSAADFAFPSYCCSALVWMQIFYSSSQSEPSRILVSFVSCNLLSRCFFSFSLRLFHLKWNMHKHKHRWHRVPFHGTSSIRVRHNTRIHWWFHSNEPFYIWLAYS